MNATANTALFRSAGVWCTISATPGTKYYLYGCSATPQGGPWVGGAVVYYPQDVVTVSNVMYVCVTQNTNNSPPNANWSVVQPQFTFVGPSISASTGTNLVLNFFYDYTLPLVFPTPPTAASAYAQIGDETQFTWPSTVVFTGGATIRRFTNVASQNPTTSVTYFQLDSFTVGTTPAGWWPGMYLVFGSGYTGAGKLQAGSMYRILSSSSTGGAPFVLAGPCSALTANTTPITNGAGTTTITVYSLPPAGYVNPGTYITWAGVSAGASWGTTMMAGGWANGAGGTVLQTEVPLPTFTFYNTTLTVGNWAQAFPTSGTITFSPYSGLAAITSSSLLMQSLGANVITPIADTTITKSSFTNYFASPSSVWSSAWMATSASGIVAAPATANLPSLLPVLGIKGSASTTVYATNFTIPAGLGSGTHALNFSSAPDANLSTTPYYPILSVAPAGAIGQGGLAIVLATTVPSTSFLTGTWAGTIQPCVSAFTQPVSPFYTQSAYASVESGPGAGFNTWKVAVSGMLQNPSVGAPTIVGATTRLFLIEEDTTRATWQSPTVGNGVWDSASSTTNWLTNLTSGSQVTRNLPLFITPSLGNCFEIVAPVMSFVFTSQLPAPAEFESPHGTFGGQTTRSTQAAMATLTDMVTTLATGPLDVTEKITFTPQVISWADLQSSGPLQAPRVSMFWRHAATGSVLPVHLQPGGWVELKLRFQARGT